VHFLSLELPRRKGKLLRSARVTRTAEIAAARRAGASHGECIPRRTTKTRSLRRLAFLRIRRLCRRSPRPNELGRFARARAKEKHGREFAASEIDVIGDTPRDIACGKALGARTIAVATGTWGRDELAKHHPDFLIDDLSNVETIMDTLGW